MRKIQSLIGVEFKDTKCYKDLLDLCKDLQKGILEMLEEVNAIEVSLNAALYRLPYPKIMEDFEYGPYDFIVENSVLDEVDVFLRYNCERIPQSLSELRGSDMVTSDLERIIEDREELTRRVKDFILKVC